MYHKYTQLNNILTLFAQNWLDLMTQALTPLSLSLSIRNSKILEQEYDIMPSQTCAYVCPRKNESVFYYTLPQLKSHQLQLAMTAQKVNLRRICSLINVLL